MSIFDAFPNRINFCSCVFFSQFLFLFVQNNSNVVIDYMFALHTVSFLIYETNKKKKKFDRLARPCPILFFLATASRVENQKRMKSTQPRFFLRKKQNKTKQITKIPRAISVVSLFFCFFFQSANQFPDSREGSTETRFPCCSALFCRPTNAGFLRRSCYSKIYLDVCLSAVSKGFITASNFSFNSSCNTSSEQGCWRVLHVKQCFVQSVSQFCFDERCVSSCLAEVRLRSVSCNQKVDPLVVSQKIIHVVNLTMFVCELQADSVR